MKRCWLMTTFAMLVPSTALAEGTVTLRLESSSQGQTVSRGALIDWTIKVAVSTGDNQGLALVCVDLVQDDGNPAFLDIPPADASRIDAVMDDFSRPLGICNMGEDGATTGYIGVQRGAEGRKNLIQIGGGQNTLGVVGPADLGQDCTVDGGVGQGASPQVVVSGSLAAPSRPGTYTFRLHKGLANVLTAVHAPPQPSSVAPPAVDLTAGSFSFTVSPELRGDLNCDGAVTLDDINPFVAALVSRSDYEAQYANCLWLNGDINLDGSVDFDDINPFVACLVHNGCP